MALNFQVDEATAAQRRFPLYLVDATDGITPETGEAAGQPQVSENGAAFVNTSATLTAIGNGSYYVELTAAELSTLGMLTVRYKSAATAEFSLTGQVVAYDPYAAYALASIATETRLAELDAGNIPTDLSNIQSDTDDIQTRLPAALVGGRIDSNVGALGGTVQSATDLKDFADEGYDPVTNKVQGVVLVDTSTANSDMRGTDGVDTAAMRGTDGVDTAAMRGTDNAALASVLGALADVAADGDPTAVDTVMQYIKQLVNVLVGTAGVVTYPAAAAPGNGVSLAQVLRENFDDVTGLNGDAMRGTDGVDTAVMRGTDSAALAVNVPDIISLANINAEVDTALIDARLDELMSATAGGVDPTIGSFLDLIMNAGAGQTFSQATDSLEAIANAIAGLNDLSQAQILSDATPFAGANIDAAISSRAAAGDAMDLIAGAIDAATFVANAITAAVLATDAGQEIADRILARSIASAADGGRTVQDALRLLRNRRAIAAGILTVYEEDDVTPAWTAPVTTAAGDPVVEIDPA